PRVALEPQDERPGLVRQRERRLELGARQHRRGPSLASRVRVIRGAPDGSPGEVPRAWTKVLPVAFARTAWRGSNDGARSAPKPLTPAASIALFFVALVVLALTAKGALAQSAPASLDPNVGREESAENAAVPDLHARSDLTPLFGKPIRKIEVVALGERWK